MENREEYIMYIQNKYNDLMSVKEERNISYGELYHIENLSDKELKDLEEEIDDEFERIIDIVKDYQGESNIEKAYKTEIDFQIENIVNDEFEDEDFKKRLTEITDGEYNDIISSMLEDNELNECLSSTIRYYLKKQFKKEVEK